MDGVIIPRHAKAQAEKRGISESEILEALENGEILFSEVNGRFGTKNYSKLDAGEGSIICVWFSDRKGNRHVVTVYRRERR